MSETGPSRRPIDRTGGGISRVARATLSLVLIVALAIEVGVLVRYLAPAPLVDGGAILRAVRAIVHAVRTDIASLDPVTAVVVGAAAAAAVAFIGLLLPLRTESAEPDPAESAGGDENSSQSVTRSSHPADPPAPDSSLSTPLEADHSLTSTASAPPDMPGAIARASCGNGRLRRLEVSVGRMQETRAALVSGMSHELRILMNGIVGNGDLLLACQLSGRERDHAEAIMASARDLLSVIDELVEHSGIAPETTVLKRDRFSIRAALEQSCRPLATRARGRGVGLRVLEDHSIPPYSIGDVVRFRQMIGHLVRNAINATGAGGEVLVRIGRIAGGSPGDGRFQCTVSDTGAGMTPEAQMALWSRLKGTVETERHEDGEAGLGMSLAAVQKIADLMGGELSMTSRLGVGTSVTVTMNLAEVGDRHDQSGIKRAITSEQPTSAPLPERGERDRIGGIAEHGDLPLGQEDRHASIRAPIGSVPSTAHVLVVEDNEVNQAVARGLLENLGCTVSVAANGREAVAMTADTLFDMILMDCRMPEMDGYEATAAIRASAGSNKTTPIVALTANAMSGDRRRCLDAGMDDYLAKPVWSEDLEERLQRWVARTASSEAAGSAGASATLTGIGNANTRSIDNVLADVALQGAVAAIRDVETTLDEEAWERLREASERLLERARRIRNPELVSAAEALCSVTSRPTSMEDDLSALAAEAIEKWSRARSESGADDTEVRDAA